MSTTVTNQTAPGIQKIDAAASSSIATGGEPLVEAARRAYPADCVHTVVSYLVIDSTTTTGTVGGFGTNFDQLPCLTSIVERWKRVELESVGIKFIRLRGDGTGTVTGSIRSSLDTTNITVDNAGQHVAGFATSISQLMTAPGGVNLVIPDGVRGMLMPVTAMGQAPKLCLGWGVSGANSKFMIELRISFKVGGSIQYTGAPFYVAP